MEGGIVYYDQADLDEFHRELPPLVEDTISPLGQIYAEYNARQREVIDEYDRRRRAVEAANPREDIWHGADHETTRSAARSEDAHITIVYVSIDSGDRALTDRANPN